MLKDIADRSGGVTEAGDVSRNEDRQNISTAIISDSSDKNLTIVEQPVAAGAPVKVAQVGVLPPPAGNGPVTHVKPNANGVVILPDGAKIATIQAQGSDLRIVLDDGRVFIVDGGVANPPSVQIGSETVPANSLAAVFGPIQEVQPAAGDTGPQSSGNNFTNTSTTIDQAFQISDLLGPGVGVNNTGPGDNETDFFDDAPVVGTQVDFNLDEDALDGSLIDPSSTGVATYNGQLNINYGANGANLLAPIEFDPATLTGITSGGEAVTFTWDQTTMTLTGVTTGGATVFSLQITDAQTGTFTVTISGPLDHTGPGRDGLPIAFPFIVRDGNGTETPGVLNATILDDVPVSFDVIANQSENADLYINVTDGLGFEFYSGADGLDSISIGTATLVGPGGVLFGAPQINLTGTVNPDVFQLSIVPGTAFDGLSSTETATLTIPYTVIDGDGDVTTSSFIITIQGTNDGPVIDSIAQRNLNEQTNNNPLTTTINVTFEDLDYNDIGHAAEITNAVATGATTGLALDKQGLIDLFADPIVSKALASQDGTVTLNFSAPVSAFNYLATGQLLYITYTLEVDDGDGGVATRDFVVRIRGTNDAPVLDAGAGNFTEFEDRTLDFTARTIIGTMDFVDPDLADTGHFSTIASITRGGESDGLLGGIPGNLILASYLSLNTVKLNGSDQGQIHWTFTAPDTQFDYLAQGQFVTITYNIRLRDGDGGDVTQPLTITVYGTNDRPVFAGPGFRIDNEDLFQTGSSDTHDFNGTLAFAEPDRDDIDHTATVDDFAFAATGTTTGLVLADAKDWLNVTGVAKTVNSIVGTVSWNFSAPDSAFDYLAAGESVTLTYTVVLDDGEGAGNSTDTTTVSVTILGTNDRPVLGAGTDPQAIRELANIAGSPTLREATGTFNFTDADLSDAHTATVALTGSSWAGDPDVLDAFDPSTLVGANAMKVSIKPGDEATGDGAGKVTWNFSVQDQYLDFLANNETITLTYTVTLKDDSGTSNDTAGTQTVTVTLRGRNDAPVIAPETDPNIVQEMDDTSLSLAANTVNGSLFFTDVDLNDTGHFAQVISVSRGGMEPDGLPSGFVGNLLLLSYFQVDDVIKNAGDANGEIKWSFSAPDTQFDYLAQGQSATLTYVIRLRDGDGGQHDQTVTITIIGSNDRPVFVAGDFRLGVENFDSTGQNLAFETHSGTLLFTDLDRDDIGHTAVVDDFAFAATGTTTGLVVADAQDWLNVTGVTKTTNSIGGTVSWTFNAPDSAFDYLAAGETVTLTYTVVLNDNEGDGANSVDTTTVTVTIVGTNDRPVVATGDKTGALLEVANQTGSPVLSSDVTGTLNFTDADLSNAAHISSSVLQSAVWSDGVTPDSIGAVPTAQMFLNAAFTTLADQGTLGDGQGTIDWKFSIADQYLDFLAAGEKLTLTYVVSVNDQTGTLNAQSTTNETVTITITGTNDKPVIAASEFVRFFDNPSDSIDDSLSGGRGVIVLTASGTNGIVTADGSSYALMSEAADTGPFTRFGGYQTAWTGAWVASTKVWLDTSWAAGEGFDYTVASNNAAGDHLRDFIFHVAVDSTGNLVIAVSNNTDFQVPSDGKLAGLDKYDVPSTGWYTLEHRFYDNNGVLAVEFRVLDAAGAVVFTDTIVTSDPMSNVGGNRYGWFTFIDIPAGLAVDEISLDRSNQLYVVEFADNSIDETSGTHIVSGEVNFTDVDLTDVHTVSATPLDAGYLGTFTPTVSDPSTGDGAGKISWTFTVSDAAIEYLAAGQTLNQSYVVTLDDGNGGTDTTVVTVTITGSNDGPVITVESGDSEFAGLTETNAGLSASGTLTATDMDVTDVMTVSVVGVSATGSNIESLFTEAEFLSFFSVGPNPVDSNSTTTGKITWSFDSTPEAFDFLPHGFQSIISYTVRVSDGQGGYDDHVVQIKLTGTNDAPVIDSATAQLLIVNSGFEADTYYNSSGGEGRWTDGNPTGWTLSGPGTGAGWYDPGVPGVGGDPARIETDASHGTNILFLNDGQSATQTLAATAQAGTYTFSVDVGDREDNGLTGQPSFALRLYAGSTLVGELVVPAEMADGPDWHNVSFNVTVPLNAAYLGQPLRIELANLEQQGGGGDFSHITQVNFDNVSLTFSSGNTTLFTIDEDQTGNAGQTVASILGNTVTDVDAGAVEGIAIIGSDDGNGTWQYFDTTTSTWENFGSYSEGSALLLRATDLVRFVPNGLNGTTATFDYVAWDQTGSSNGQQFTTRDVTTRGGTTPYSNETAKATITVTSVNDAPVITVPGGESINTMLPGYVGETVVTRNLGETNAGLTTTGSLTVSDVDLNDIVNAAVVSVSGGGSGYNPVTAGALAFLTLSANPIISGGENSDTLTWTFNSGSEAFNFLQPGFQTRLTYVIRVTDSAGATDDQVVSILITGTNDAPVIQGFVNPAGITEVLGDSSAQDLLVTGGSLTVLDLDNGQTLTASVTGSGTAVWSEGALPSGVDVSALIASGAITFSAPQTSNGTAKTFTWTYDPLPADLDWLAAGETLTITYTGRVSDGVTNATQTLTLVITGTNDAPVIESGQSLEFRRNFDGPSDTIVDGTSGGQGQVLIVASGNGGIVTQDGSDFALLSEVGGAAPFTRFDGYQSAWTGNWTAEVKVYLDTSWANGSGFQYSVASSKADGNHLRDFIFHVTKDSSSGDLLVAATNNSTPTPRQDLETLNHYEVTQSGWYTLRHVFKDVGGVLTVDLQLVDANGTVLWTETRSNPADLIASVVGGNRYGWFTDITIPGGLAVDGISLNRQGTGATIVEFADNSVNETVGLHSASGSVPFTDLDLTDTHTVSAAPAGTGYLGTFTPVIGDDSTGDTAGTINWTFSVSDADIEHLAAGETLTQTYTVTVDDGHGGTDTVDVTITITGTNDAPEIVSGQTTGAVTEAGDLPGIMEATGGANVEPAILLNATVNTTLDDLITAPGGVEAALATVQTELGVNLQTAIAIIWEFLDDSYVNAGSNQVNVNEAFVRLGVEYVEYLKNGGAALLDVTAKYTVDTGDAGTLPDRFQPLHDNLLGNLRSASMGGRFSGQLLIDLTALVTGVEPDLLTRVLYEGNENQVSQLASARAFDQAHGYLPAATGTLVANDVDNGATYSWSGTANGTYGTFEINAATGQWTYRLDNARTVTQALTQGQVETETFTVTVTDQYGANDTVNVVITITGTNDAPAFSSVFTTAAGTEDTAYTITQAQLQSYISTAVTDVDTALTNIEYTLTVKNGATTVATFTFTGTVPSDFTFNPPANFQGNLSATLTANDGYATTATNFTIGISSVNDAPVLSNVVNMSTNEDTTIYFRQATTWISSDPDQADGKAPSLTLVVNVTSGEGVLSASRDGLSGGFNIVSSNGGKTLTITTFADEPGWRDAHWIMNTLLRGDNFNISTNPNGIAFTPATNYNGPVTFSYTLSDNGWNGAGGPQSTSGTFTLNVNSVIDAVFTEGVDNVNLNNFAEYPSPQNVTNNPWFEDGNFMDAKGGDDIVTLPNAASELGDPDGYSYASRFAAGEIFKGGAGNDTIYGGDLNDRIDGGEDNDTIYGNDGNDYIIGGAGNDTLSGGEGNDTFVLVTGGFDNGLDQYDGGNGYDRIVGGWSYDTLNVTWNLSNLVSIEEIDGGDGQPGYNTILGTTGNDVLDFTNIIVKDFVIDGGEGDDTITGTAGNDHIRGGAGNDTLNGGLGNDTFYLVTANFDNGLDQYNGGDGYDRIVGGWSYDTLNVTWNLSNLNSIEELEGGGSIAYNTILSTSGADSLNFTNIVLKDFQVNASAGDDIVYVSRAAGSTSNTIYNGGANNDTLAIVLTEAEAFDLSPTSLRAALSSFGPNGNFSHPNLSFTSQNFESLQIFVDIGGVLTPFDGLNTLIGTPNHDNGNPAYAPALIAPDTTKSWLILGRGGDDILEGGDKNDILNGEGGNDAMYGKGGDDTFIVTNTSPANGFDRFDGGSGYDRIISGDGSHIQASALVDIEEISANGYSGVNLVGSGGAHDNFDLSNVKLVGINEVVTNAGDDTITTANVSDAAGGQAYRGGQGNDVFNFGTADTRLLVSSSDNGGFDRFSNNTAGATHTVIAQNAGTNIGISGNYGGTNSVDEITANGNANVNIVGSSSVHNNWDFSNTTLTGIAQIRGGDATANDTIVGSAAGDTILGLGGNDILSGGGGDDTFIYSSGHGRDTVDGGADNDTQIINGSTNDETFNVNAITVGGNAHVGVNIEAGAMNIVAATASNYEVATRNVEDLVINTGGGSDHVEVTGSLNGTGLSVNTITVDLGTGNDTFDASGRSSAHRVVVDGGDGTDTAEMGFNFGTAQYTKIMDGVNLVGVEVKHQIGGVDVTDTYTNVENFAFADGNKTLAEIFAVAPDNTVNVFDTNGDFVATYNSLANAVNNASTLNGYTLKLGAGTYTHTGQLNIGKSLFIEGSGMGETIIKQAGSVGGTEARTVQVNAQDVTFKNLTFAGWANDTTPSNAGSGYLVWANGSAADGITFDGVQFDADNIRVAVYIGTADDVTITNSLFTGDLYRYAIRGAGEHMEITDNVFQTAHYQGGPIYMEYGAPTSGTISGNLFEHSYGVDTFAAGNGAFQSDGSLANTIMNWQPNAITADGLYIENNTFRFMSGDAVHGLTGSMPQSTAILNDGLVPASGPIVIRDNSFEGYGYEGPTLLPTSVAGRTDAGNALDFQGSNAYASFVMPVDIGQQGTMSVWLQLDNTGKRNQIVEGPGNGGLEFQYRPNDPSGPVGPGQFYGSTNGGNSENYAIQNGDAAAYVNSWTNVQYVWDFQGGASTKYMKIYVNGTEVTYLSATYDSLLQNWLSTLNTAGGTFYVGRDPGDSSRMLDGRIDELAFFNTVLTKAELDQVRTNVSTVNTTLFTSLVALWLMNSIDGNVVHGSGGTNIDLTLQSLNADPNPPVIVVNGGEGTEITNNTFDNTPYIIANGNEIIGGTGANDILDGGTGIDVLDLSHATAPLDFTLVQSASDTTFTAPGIGTDTYRNFEGVIGSDYADVLHGSNGNDIIYGGGGDDIIEGNGGNDVLIGGAGADTLTGGLGADTFVMTDLSAADVITDYNSAEGDMIDLSALFKVPVGQDPQANGYVELDGNQLKVDIDGGGDSWQVAVTFSSAPSSPVTILYDRADNTTHTTSIT